MRSPPPRPPSARRPPPSSTTFAALVAGAAVAYSVAACNSPSSLELGCPLSPLALDAPPYAALGAAVAGVSSDKTHSLTVSEDGLRCAASGEQWGSGRCGVCAPPGGGVYYFEATQLPPADGDAAAGGILRVGLSTDRASLALGTDTEGFGYGGTGVKCSGLLKADREPRPGQPAGSAFAPYGRKFGAGDVVGVTLDRRDGTIRYCVNGEDQGVAFVVPPILARAPLHPALAVKGCAAILNLGETPLAHLPPGATSFVAAASADVAAG